MLTASFQTVSEQMRLQRIADMYRKQSHSSSNYTSTNHTGRPMKSTEISYATNRFYFQNNDYYCISTGLFIIHSHQMPADCCFRLDGTEIVQETQSISPHKRTNKQASNQSIKPPPHNTREEWWINSRGNMSHELIFIDSASRPVTMHVCQLMHQSGGQWLSVTHTHTGMGHSHNAHTGIHDRHCTCFGRHSLREPGQFVVSNDSICYRGHVSNLQRIRRQISTRKGRCLCRGTISVMGHPVILYQLLMSFVGGSLVGGGDESVIV